MVSTPPTEDGLMNSLPLCTVPEGRMAEYLSLYAMILPLGEWGGVQERWIALEDTVVAVNDSTAPGTERKDVHGCPSDNHQNELYYIIYIHTLFLLLDGSHIPSSGVMMTTGLLKGPSPTSFTALTLNW